MNKGKAGKARGRDERGRRRKVSGKKGKKKGRLPRGGQEYREGKKEGGKRKKGMNEDGKKIEYFSNIKITKKKKEEEME